MFSRLKATSPAATKTSSPSKMIGRRVSPNATRPLSTACLYPRSCRQPQLSLVPGGDGHHVVEENGAVCGHQFANLHAVENLPVAIAHVTDRHRASGEMAAVGGHPDSLRAVTFPHHTVEWDRWRTDRRPYGDGEISEHARAQLVLRIVDLRAHQDTTRIRVHNRTDRGDLAVKRPIGEGI